MSNHDLFWSSLIVQLETGLIVEAGVLEGN